MTKILVIDDDAVQRVLLTAVFRQQGLEVLQAPNGQEGIRLARDRRPDLIVSDVNLPEMDGFAVLDHLRKEPITATIPFIFMTANPDEADQRRARKSGASGYLPKPVPISDLRALVNAEIGKQERLPRRMAKVLVIDDDNALRATLAASLIKKGFEVIEAADGAEGVKLAQAQLPDLILCDVNMSGADGYLTLHALRHDPKLGSIPFLLMTGQPNDAGMRQAMELGADDYLAKPFSNKQLFAAIEARVQKHQSIRKEVEEKLAELRSSISQVLPDELSGSIRQIVSMTEFISTGHRHLEQDEIVPLTKDVYQAALRLQRLIDNCLLYAELEVLATDPEKVATLRKSKSYVGAVVEPAMFQKARQMQRYADLVLDRTLNDAQLSMSPVYLKKIVDELLDNAFKFSKPGSPVQVKTSLTDTEFKLAVADHGPGMTPEQARKVGAYVQFGRKLHEQHGSGLGLAIARRLTQLHQGKFTVEGEPGHGTTVTVCLPLARKN